jgi:heme exporter protein CcmD
MGGYAAYVWGSYLVVALVLGGLLVWSRQQLKSRRAALARLKAQEDRRAEIAGGEPEQTNSTGTPQD